MTSNHEGNEQQQMAAACVKARALLAEAQRIAQLGTWRRDCANDALEWSDETRRMFDWPAHLPVTYTGFLNVCIRKMWRGWCRVAAAEAGQGHARRRVPHHAP